jgi:hypothetical protein
MEEAPVAQALSTEASQRAESAFGTVDSLPIALAERLDAADRSASSHEPPLIESFPFEGDPSAADPASVEAFIGESPGPVDEPPPPAASSTGEPAADADERPAPAALIAEAAGHVDESACPVAAFTGEPARPVDEPASPAAAFTGEGAGSGDGSPSRRSPGYRPIFTERSRNRVGGFLLAAILVAAAVTIYWLTGRPTHPPAENAAPAESTVAPAPDAPVRSPQRANAPIESPTDAPPLPNAAAPQGPSDSSASSTKPNASATSRVPSATVQAPERPAAQAPPVAGNPASVDGGTAKPGSAPLPGEARRRASTPQRSKDQADRDASATQRLIERELGEPRRSDSDTKPPAQ